MHVDIWGPYSAPSVTGFRFFLTFVDDKSRFTWVRLMKAKSETRASQFFISFIQTQFQKQIIVIRSDNGV